MSQSKPAAAAIDPAPVGAVRLTNIPASLRAALAICVVATVVTGVLPGLVGEVSDTVGLVVALP
jgi:hypothetical protein